MTENPRNNGISHGTTAVLGFTIGALVGAGIALLLAPAKGQDTRRRLADATGRLGDAARTEFDKARDTANDVGHDMKMATRTHLEKARETVSDLGHDIKIATRTQLDKAAVTANHLGHDVKTALEGMGH